MNGVLASWVSGFFLLTIFRVRSLLTWNFLLINTYQEASSIMLVSTLNLIQQLYHMNVSFTSIVGVAFLFFGAFIAGISSKSNGEAILSFIFFLLALFSYTIISLDFFSSMFLGLSKNSAPPSFPSFFELLLFGVTSLLALPFTLLGESLVSS